MAGRRESSSSAAEVKATKAVKKGVKKAQEERFAARERVRAAAAAAGRAYASDQDLSAFCEDNPSADCGLLEPLPSPRSGGSGLEILLLMAAGGAIYYFFKAITWSPPQLLLRGDVPDASGEGIQLDAANFAEDDLIRLSKAPGEVPTAPGKVPTYTTITLQTGPTVTWWKGLAFAPDGNRWPPMIAREHGVTLQGSGGEATMDIPSADLATGRLWFAKAKFLGIHTIVSYLETADLVPYTGQHLYFLWQRDEVAGQEAIIQ